MQKEDNTKKNGIQNKHITISRKIKILFFIDSLVRGGAETLLLQMCKKLISYNLFSISVITYRDQNDLTEGFLKLGISVECLFLEQRAIVSRFTTAFHAIKKYNPDIIHTHLLYSDRYGLLSAFLAGVRYRISTNHSEESSLSIHYRITQLLTALFASRVICVSESVKNFCSHIDLFKKRYFKKKLVTICNAVSIDASQYAPKKFSSSLIQHVRIVTVGRLETQKNQVDLVQSIKNLQNNKHCTYEMSIYGKGSEKQNLEKRINEWGLEAVFLRGELDHSSLMSQVYSHDIYVSPSLNEGFGLAVVEAMSLGLPVILSDIHSHRELFADSLEPYPYFFKPHDHETISQFIESMKQENVYNHAAELSYKASLKYSFQTMIEKYKNLYLEHS